MGLGKPLGAIMGEMRESHSDLHVGDVKYHCAMTHIMWNSAKQEALGLNLSPNPSHLEIITPVVLGRVRTRQDRHMLRYAGSMSEAQSKSITTEPAEGRSTHHPSDLKIGQTVHTLHLRAG